MMQYVVSCLHHWCPHSDWRSKLDRSVIFWSSELRMFRTGEICYHSRKPRNDCPGLQWRPQPASHSCCSRASDSCDRGVLGAVCLLRARDRHLDELRAWLPPFALAGLLASSALYGSSNWSSRVRNGRDPAPGLSDIAKFSIYCCCWNNIRKRIALNYT